MLTRRKATKDKRVVADIRHLNVTIAKITWYIFLHKDTVLVLGCSRCEPLSILVLKDLYHSLRLSEISKRFCGILPYFGISS